MPMGTQLTAVEHGKQVDYRSFLSLYMIAFAIDISDKIFLLEMFSNPQ